MSIDIKPHAYDPATQPELFEGVLARRVVAFIDRFRHYLHAGGAGGHVHFRVRNRHPGTRLCALLAAALRDRDLGDFYFGFTLGGPASATVGMRVMDIEMRTWYGAPAYFVLGAVHAVAFWFTVSFFTPFVLLVCFLQRAAAGSCTTSCSAP